MKTKKILTASMALVLSVVLAVSSALALGPVSETIYRGIDVSVYQGDIDFHRVKEAGIEVVYIRAGEGSDYKDTYFEANAQKAKEAGLHFGFYLYVTARTEEQAREQARFFSDLIQNKEYTCRPAMDLEQFSGMSEERINEVGLAFLKELESLTGITPMIYTDAYAANRIWNEEFGAYPLWVANYGVEEPDVRVDTWPGWTGFQYSDEGRVDGIADYVDLNRFTDNALIKGVDPTPTPEPSEGIRYVVKRGDTLWAISKRYNVTIDEIVRANNIKNPDLIYAGETLIIPVEEDYVTYIVKRGDTLWAISRKYDTTVSAIVQQNNIKNPDLIYPGEAIKIPVR